MRIGEIILPVLAFLAVFYIVISVGSQRGPLTFFQTNEIANMIDSLSSFNGIASISYLPIEKDFIARIKDNALQMNFPDGKAPNSKQLHIPQDLRLYMNFNDEKSADLYTNLKQMQITKANSSLHVYAIPSQSLQVEKKLDVYDCPMLNLAPVPVYLDIVRDPNRLVKDEGSDKLESDFELRRALTQKGILITDNVEEAALVIYLQIRQADFNSLVLIPESNLVSMTFSCAVANEINNVQRPLIKNSQSDLRNIDSAVLVRPTDGQYVGVVDKKLRSKASVVVELTYKQDKASQPQEVLYYAILSKSLLVGYKQVYS